MVIAMVGCEEPTTSLGPLLGDNYASSEVPALWRPAGLAVDSRGDVLVFEQATGRVRRITPEGNASTSASIRPGLAQGVTLPIERIGPDVGLEIVVLDDGAYVLASRSHPLVVVDAAGVAAESVGRASGGRAPANDATLAELDTSELRGFARWHGTTAYVLAIGNQLWRATPPDGLEGIEALRQSRLTLLAGDGRRGVAGSGVDAVDAPLDLGDWVGIAAHDEELIFIEGPRLRYVADARLLTLTGEGTQRGAGRFSFEAFSSSFLGFSHAEWADGAFYVLDDRQVRRVHIDSVNPAAGTATGEVSSVSHGAPEINDFAVTDEGLLLSWGYGGTVLTFPAIAAESSIIEEPDAAFDSLLGPLDPDVRYRLTDANGGSNPDHAPYRAQRLMLPQGIGALFGGEVILVNEPLARLILAVDRATDPPTVSEFWTSSKKRSWGLGPMTTDGAYRASWVDRTLLVHFDTGVFQRHADQGQTCPNDDPCIVGLNIFRRPNTTGVPGVGSHVRFAGPLVVRAGTRQLVLFSSHTDELLTYELSDGWTDTEAGPRLGSTPIDSSIPPRFFSIALAGASQVEAQGDAVRLVALPDPSGIGARLAVGHARYACELDGCHEAPYDCESDDQCGGRLACVEGACVYPFAGRLVGTGDYLPVVGGGTAAVSDGMRAEEVSLEAIEAFTYIEREGASSALILAGQQGSPAFPFTLTSDGRIDAVSGCSPLSEPADWVATWPPHTWPAEAMLVRGSESAQVYGCRFAPAGAVWVGGVELPSESWVPLGITDADVRPEMEGDGAFIARYVRHRGMATIWIDAIARQRTDATTRRLDVDLDYEDQVHSMALSASGDALYFSVSHDNAVEVRAAAIRGPLPDEGLPALPAWVELAGGGVGLPATMGLAEAALGTDPTALAVGPSGDIYVTVRDTEALWRLRMGEDGWLDGRDHAELVWQGAPLFGADAPQHAMTIAPDGAVFVGAAGSVYRVADNEARRVAGGGVLPLASGVSPQGRLLGEIRGLAMLDDVLVVHADAALFAIDQGDAQVMHPSGEADDSGTTRVLDTDLMFSSTMTAGRAGEVLVSAPLHSDILSLRPALP